MPERSIDVEGEGEGDQGVHVLMVGHCECLDEMEPLQVQMLNRPYRWVALSVQ